MPSILRELPAVAWLAGKNFRYEGREYKVGDEIPEINEFPRLEVWVRTRHVIPIVETKDDIPFQFRHIVMTRERAIRKLGSGHAPGGPSDVKASRTVRKVEKKTTKKTAAKKTAEKPAPSKEEKDERQEGQVQGREVQGGSELGSGRPGVGGLPREAGPRGPGSLPGRD